MDLVKYYTEMSRKEALDNESIREFNDEVNCELSIIENMRLNTDILHKLLHPYRLIKNNIRYKKLIKIRNKFEDILDSNVLMYASEETGDLESDLNSAAMVYKPKYIKDFVESVRVKK